MCYQFEIVHQSPVWCFRRVKILHVVGTDPEFSCWLQDKNGEQKEERKTRRAPPHGWICEGIKDALCHWCKAHSVQNAQLSLTWDKLPETNMWKVFTMLWVWKFDIKVRIKDSNDDQPSCRSDLRAAMNPPKKPRRQSNCGITTD